jgi:Bacteriophage Mu Gam like protein
MEKTFLDELLEEVEAKEVTLHLAHIDLILAEMKNMEDLISKNFEQTEKEIQILNEWTLRKNSKLQDRIDFMSKKLEAYMREQEGVKTIDLPNGKLLRRKQPDKIQIENFDEFMLNADASMLTVNPESVRPDLRKVMAYYKRRLIPPVGTKVVVGEEKFSIKLNNNKKEQEDNGTTSETGAGNKQRNSYKAAV